MMDTSKIGRPTAQLREGDRVYFLKSTDGTRDSGEVVSFGPRQYEIRWESDGETITYPRGEGGIWTTDRRDGEVLSWESAPGIVRH